MYRKIKCVLSRTAMLISIFVSVFLMILLNIDLFYNRDWMEHIRNDAYVSYNGKYDTLYTVTFLYSCTESIWLEVICLVLLLTSVYLFQKSFEKEPSQGGAKIYDCLFCVLIFLLGMSFLRTPWLWWGLVAFIFLVIALLLKIVSFSIKIPNEQSIQKTSDMGSIIDKRMPEVNRWKEEGVINQEQYNAMVEKIIAMYLKE